MSTRKPPIAPKTSGQLHSVASATQPQLIVEAVGLETGTASPRTRHSHSDHGGSLGPIRPRSPRPAEVYSAALAELNEGEGRGLLKIKLSTASPASSPGRRRGTPSVNGGAALNPLSPRTYSILDQQASLKASNSVAGAPSSALLSTSSSRYFTSLLDDPRNSPHDGGTTSGGGSLPHTPPRKVTSAPDSQSYQALQRTSANPWRTSGGVPALPDSPSRHLSPQPPQHLPYGPLSPQRAGVAAASAHGHSPHSSGQGQGQVPIPPIPTAWGTSAGGAGPAAGGGGHSTQTVSASGGLQGPGAAGQGPGHGMGYGLPPAPPQVLTNARQRRDSASSSDSHSPGVYDSPMAGAGGGSAFRASSLGRTPVNGSPTTPSTPSTPTCSNLRPKPPGADAPNGSLATRYSRLSLGPSTELAQGQGQGQGHSSPAQGLPPASSVGRQQPSTSGGSARQLLGAFAAEEALMPSSLGRTGSNSLAAMLAANSSLGGGGGGAGYPYASLPGTPSGGSRPGSARAGSRAARPPAALLVDAVRSKDERKLEDTLDFLRGPQGNVQGLNDRHHVTGRTPLHEAVMSNSTSMVRILLDAGADPNIGHESQGPPLLHAAAFGEVECAELLLQEGADVHARDVDGQSALHFACTGGHIEMARMLIVKYSADWRAKNNDEEMPFDTNPDMLRLVMAGAPSDGGRSIAAVGNATMARHPTMRAAVAAGVVNGVASPTLSSRNLHQRLGSGGGSGGGAVQQVPHSPAAQPIDVSPHSTSGGSVAAAAAAALAPRRPAPPTEPNPSAAAAVLASRPRSRRNSGNFYIGGAPSSGPGSSPLRPSSASGGPGNGPLPSPTQGQGQVAAAGAAAVADLESVPPPSPPTLQLPGGVRRQLSRGAQLGDIIRAFNQEDAEMVRNSQPPPEGSSRPADATAHVSHMEPGVGWRPPLHPAPAGAHHPPGMPLAPGTKPGPSKSAPNASGAPAAPSRLSAGSSSTPTSRPGSSTSTKPDDPTNQPPQQPLLPFSMPETSLIRFGVPVQVHAGETSPTSSHPNGPSEPLQPQPSMEPLGFRPPPPIRTTPSGAGALPSFSAGISAAAPTATEGMEGPAAGSPDSGPVGNGFSAVGFVPVPTTGFTPRFSNSGSGGSGDGAAVGWRFGNGGGAPVVAGGGGGGGGRASASGDDLGAGAPPLVRDSSPVRDRPNGSGGGGGGGGGSGTGLSGVKASGPGAGLGTSGERHAPTRTSHLAAQALKRISNTNVSMEALELRAAALFRQSMELTTGVFAWTKGELLGEGAFGKVYAGLNQQTGELMAVKVMQLINKNSHKEAVETQLQELQHEMSLYKKLAHRHVVGFIHAEYDVKSSAFFIFLEYVPGGSIASMLSRFGRFSEDLVRNYTRQLLLGLEYLHGCKIVHRDLKGGNVLVSRDGVVKLADFGASKAYRDTTITDCMKSVRGSVFWMAPEVIRGTGYGRRADIWSLGCTVIEMLTGTHPWPHLDNQWTAMFTIAKCEEGPPRPKGIGEEAARFLDKCLQFDPAKRPTAAELLQDPFVALRPGMGPAVAAAVAGEDRLQHSF